MFESLERKLQTLHQLPSDRSTLVAMKQRLDAEWTFHEMAVSGSPLARMDVRRIIEAKHHVVLRASVLREAHHFHRTSRYLETSAHRLPAALGEEVLFKAHGLLSGDLGEGLTPGWRQGPPLEREPGQAVNPGAVPLAMAEVFRWLDAPGGVHPISLATELHLRLMYIQPFAQLNARVARLWMSVLLQQAGLPPALFGAEDRIAYGEAIAKASIDGGRALERLVGVAVERAVDLCLDVCERSPQITLLSQAKTAAQ